MKRQKKASNPGAITRRLLRYVSGTYRVQFIFTFIAIVISALSGTIGILFFRRLLDDFVVPLVGKQNVDWTVLWTMVGSMAVIYYAGVLCTYIYNRLMANISQGVLKRIRDEMFEHMETLPIGYFDANATGDLMSCYTNDTDSLRQLISQSIPQALSAVVSIASIFIAMLSLSLPLSGVILVVLVVMFFVVRNIGGKSGRYFVQQQGTLGKMNGYIEEMIEGQKVVKVFNHERKAEEGFDSINEELCKSATQANTFANILMPAMGNIGNFAYLLVAIVGMGLSVSGVVPLSIGTIASFIQLTRAFVQPVGQISQQLNAIAMALAGAERIFALMDAEPETDEGYVTLANATVAPDGSIVEAQERTGIWAWKHPHSDGSVTYTRLKGDVRFFDVDFGYKPGKQILHHVSLFAKPGQKLAFVGSTGAGKTTITNLINRFYDVQDGKIRYDGININKIKKADLRRSLGMVLQDTSLFTGTILENIRFGNLNATDDELVNAAKLANADHFIGYLPEGYNTVIAGDGSSLSQGQCQLLSIARAAVANPPVLILDEATSSIDTRTESIVQAGMDKLMKGRTVFVIAHRLSTVRNSDAIIVLENGEIIERGDHDDLMQEKGKYYQLYTGALELS